MRRVVSAMVATVGWRGGQKTNRNGTVQSPRNGVYRSTTGSPRTFKKLAVTGFAAQDAIGRTELGQTKGAGQDHDILYAIVQDANLLNNGGVSGIDVPEGTSPLGTTLVADAAPAVAAGAVHIEDLTWDPAGAAPRWCGGAARSRFRTG